MSYNPALDSRHRPASTSSMQVQLTLYTSFLQTHFQAARNALEGNAQASEVVIFSSGQPEKLSGQVTVIHPQAEGTPQLPQITLKLPRVALPKLANLYLAKPIQHALTGITIFSILLLAILLAPDLYYRVFPAETVPVQATEEGTPLGGSFDRGANLEPSSTPKPLPPQDPTLPEGTWLIIPRIGVRTQPLLTEDQEEALKDGVWMVPGYGTPEDISLPIIMAAHRYGWQWWWKTDYWKYHSFYLLPDTEPGDIIEVIHDQRKYYYEIYAGEEGEEITDYSADMILYTCKFLNSPLRHFRYARQVDMAKDSQAINTTKPG